MATVANMLYNRKTKLLREGEIGTFETRFYSSDTPNEKYRIGQKHVKGKIVSITNRHDGFSFNVDISKDYNGKYNEFAITEKYIELCHIKCIVFIIDSTTLDGQTEHREISITKDEWLSTNTYITTGLVDETTESSSYNIGDIVEVTYNTTEEKNKVIIAKILNIYKYTDSSDNDLYRISFDGSTEYNFNQFTLMDSNIVGIKLYKKPEIERPWEDD